MSLTMTGRPSEGQVPYIFLCIDSTQRGQGGEGKGCKGDGVAPYLAFMFPLSHVPFIDSLPLPAFLTTGQLYRHVYRIVWLSFRELSHSSLRRLM